jgi:hypothetical protein
MLNIVTFCFLLSRNKFGFCFVLYCQKTNLVLLYTVKKQIVCVPYSVKKQFVFDSKTQTWPEWASVIKQKFVTTKIVTDLGGLDRKPPGHAVKRSFQHRHDQSQTHANGQLTLKTSPRDCPHHICPQFSLPSDCSSRPST